MTDFDLQAFKKGVAYLPLALPKVVANGFMPMANAAIEEIEKLRGELDMAIRQMGNPRAVWKAIDLWEITHTPEEAKAKP
jgi:hypothetical protein